MREPDKSRKIAWWRVRSACTGLGRDRDGSALFYTTLSLPVLVGFAVLAIDGSRLMNLNSTLQHAADGLALAAAGELDRRPDSCDRAERALKSLVENDQMFGDLGAATITEDDVTWRFLSGLPADDSEPIAASLEVDPQNPCDADSAADAQYIEVWVKPQNFTTLFPASFLGGSNTATTNAVAVAGFKQAVCKFSPVMMCNPFEPLGKSIFESEEDLKGKMIEIRQVQGPNTSYFPGNFGFLQSAALGPGANNLMHSLASASPEACFIEDGVDTEPGQNTGPVRAGLNTRFGIYEALANSLKGKANYRPAFNVRKGYDGNSCNATYVDDGVNYQGLPRDETVETELFNDNAELVGRIWSGDWDFEKYWAVNYGHSEHGKTPITAPNGWSNANRPSRYQVYRYEIEHNPDGLSTPPLLDHPSVGGEKGAPMCGATATDEIDRRILYAAVVNCEEHGPLQGKSTGIPVEAFAKFFLIRPLQQPDTIDVEFIGLTEPIDSVTRDLVQLYR